VSIRSSKFFLLSLSGALLLAACGGGGNPSDTTAPTVAISTAPSTLVSSGTVAVTVTATDDVGVSRVELYDNTIKVGEGTTAPYIFNRSYGPSDSVIHTYDARAYDAAGNTAQVSTAVKIDIQPLSVSASVQAVTTAGTGPVTVTAVANPEAGRTISKVEFLDNGTLFATVNNAPYTAILNYTAAQNGPHTITARSTDSSGAVTTATTTVTVNLDPSEPNDNVASARSIVIGTSIDGRIAGSPRDEDDFKFVAKAGDQLRLTVKSQSVFSDSTLDPYVEILLPDGRTILEKDDDSGLGLESDLRFNITQDGTYYIRLTSFNLHDDPAASDDKLTNTYRLNLSRR